MKLVVCSTGNSLDSSVDPRFGRCAFFVCVNTETLETEAVANSGVTSPQGAGIQAAQSVRDLGGEAVVAGNFGPNAFQALSAAGIKIFTGAAGTVKDAVAQFNTGKLQEVNAPTGPAHAGMMPPVQNPGQQMSSGMGGGGFGGGRGGAGGGGRFGRGRGRG